MVQRDVCNQSAFGLFTSNEKEITRQYDQDDKTIVKMTEITENVHVKNKSQLMETVVQNVLTKILTLQKQYSMIYESSPNFFRTINTEGTILNCNESYAKALGYSKSELIGTSIFDTVADESLEAMYDSFEIWKKTGNVKNREVWLKRKDGITIPVLISATNLYDIGGNLIGSNTVLTDISELYFKGRKQVELERTIQEISNQLEKQDTSRKEFIYMIRNELRSSVIHVTKSAETLLSKLPGNINGYQMEELEKIKFKSKSVLKMIHDITYMNMIENDELNLTLTQCNISKLITDVISKMKEDAAFHGSLIRTDLDVNLYCRCDENMIKEVLIQLIGNAIDFSLKGHGLIDVKLCKQDQHMKIIVKDNGIGIQKDKLEKIFEKFFQMDISILREHGGAGLGLFICRGIIEGHGGKIWAEYNRIGGEIHVLLPNH